MSRVVDKDKYFARIGYEPHPGQKPYHNSTARFRIPCCGRRFGKTMLAARDREPSLFSDPNTRGWIVGPTYGLAEKEFRVMWNDIMIKLNFIKDKKVKRAYNLRGGEMYIQMPWGAKVEVRSATQPDNLVGDELDWAIMSEAAKHKQETWERFIRPSLLDRRGGADFPSTAEGYNWYYDLWKLGQDDTKSSYQSWRFPSWMNTYLFPDGKDDEEIQLMRETTSEEWFAQEIAAEFSAFIGRIYSEFQVETHCTNHVFQPDWPNYIAFDWGFCVDEETEILTRQGWKRHTELTTDDEALGFNTETQLAEWTPVLDVHRFDGTFDMELMESKTHSSLTTQNHKWPMAGPNQFLETRQLGRNHKIPKARPVVGLPHQAKYTDSYVELVSWIWTEGYVHPNGAISVYQNEGDSANKIRKSLTEMFGAPLTKTRNGRNRAPAGWVERTSSRGLVDFYLNVNATEQFVEAIDPLKFVRCAFISLLTESQLKLFVEISLEADGFTTNTGTKCISQSHKRALDSFQMACQLLGLSTNLYKIAYGGKYKGEYGWQVSIRKYTDVMPKYKPSKRVAHTGTVWCPTTGTSTWLARRNGTTYFTGNTNPLAAIEFQVSPSDTVYVWREHYKSFWTLNQHIEHLKYGRDNPEGYHIDLAFGDAADPDAVATVSQEYVPCVAYDEAKEWRVGVELMKRFMKEYHDGISYDEYERAILVPKYFVDHSCTNHIREIQTYRRKETELNTSDMASSVVKKDDHSENAMRYALMHLFELGAGGSLAEVMPDMSRRKDDRLWTPSPQVTRYQDEFIPNDRQTTTIFTGGMGMRF